MAENTCVMILTRLWLTFLIKKASGFILSEHTLQPGAVTHTFNSSSQEAEAGGCHEFYVKLGTRARFCFNTLHHACTHSYLH